MSFPTPPLSSAGWRIYPPTARSAAALAQRLMCWSRRDPRIRVSQGGGGSLIYVVPAEVCRLYGPLALRDNAPAGEWLVCQGVPTRWLDYRPQARHIQPINVATCRGVGTPAAPDGFALSAIRGDRLGVRWQYPNTQAVTGFRVYLRRSGTTAWTQADVPATTRQHTFTGLTPGVTYELQMEAYFMATYEVTSAMVGPIAAVTATEPSVAAPSAFAVSGTPTYSSANLTWSHTGATPLDGFRLFRRIKGTTEWGTPTTYGPTARSAQISDLSPGVDYEYKLVGYATVNGTLYLSPEAGPVTVTTPALPTVEAPSAFQVDGTPTETSIGLKWSHSGAAPLSGFRLWRRVQGTTDWGTYTTLPASSRSTAATGLTQGTTYEFQIQAYASVSG